MKNLVAVCCSLSLLGIVDTQNLSIIFRGQNYTSNDIINIIDVGEDVDGVICMTTRTDCCANAAGQTRNGEWYYPNGSNVTIKGMNQDFYRNRGTQKVILNRRNNATSLTGCFCCELVNPTERVCITLAAESSTTRTCGLMATTSVMCPVIMTVPVSSLSTSPTISPSPTAHPCSKSPPPLGEPTSTLLVGAIVGGILVLLLMLILVIVLVIFKWQKRGMISLVKKYSKKDRMNSESERSIKQEEISTKPNDEEIMQSECIYENSAYFKDRLKPIPVNEFGEHIRNMHADRNKWFEIEYADVEKSPQADYSAAQWTENRARNRFGNIFPYDINRVVLKTLPGVDHSDYINASYIDGYKRRNVYIGAQGPMKNSVEDFWRMIWEQCIPTIVMLTRVFEGKEKCEKYWPETADQPFIPPHESTLCIKFDSITTLVEFNIRKMTVTKSDEPEAPPLKITMFHYVAWPDHGVPSNAVTMINFIKRVRKTHPYSKEDLLLVHCSAGVGRTGTFITLDYMLERIKNEDTINIHEFVCNLRKQRVLMVQTLSQYIFIHNALDELFTCGETEIESTNMRVAIGQLSRTVQSGVGTGFQKQYEILDKVSGKILDFDCSDATREPNVSKNRYQEKIPYNQNRVYLKLSAAQGSDYINASFVKGYRQKKAYIATQGPLPHTVNDFWRMVWEREVKCIVMLCRTEEKEEEVCHQYWPKVEGDSETFDKCTVTLLSQENSNDYIIRKMEVSSEKMSVSQSGFTVTQFQYVQWPEDGVPPVTSSLLEIANFVQRVQMGSGNKAIVVMCNDGIGRTGAFITIHAQMECMKAEAVVNIFQFIKAIRIQRAGLVSNKEHFEFCHQVLADFLDGFETYANFKEII